MKVYIVGTGMDGDKTLTSEAEKAVREADVLIGAKRMTDPFADSGKTVCRMWKADEISAYLMNCGKNTAAVLMSGDCGFFSGAQQLLKHLGQHDTTIIPGISTPVYMCAKLGIPWQDMKFVSLHGADANIVRNARRYERCFFLLGGTVTPSEICRRLCEYESGSIRVHIGSRLSYHDECIVSGTASGLINTSQNDLCAVITENPAPEGAARPGIPDSRFERGNVPMTKSEIRAVIASKLGVGCSDTVWDIGCGTGSVSVECALAADEGTVIAVDKNEEAVKLTGRNAHKFGCDNIKVIHAAAPELPDGLPFPDKLFIGGAGGNIAAILDAARKNDGSYPAAVITAVTLETLSEAVNTLKERGMKTDVTQISAVRTRTVGSHTMFDAQNPVFIIEGASV